MTRPLRILIADDSHTDRMILAAIVRQEGHIVIEATDGFEAVKQFRDTSPDLILMDAIMPGQDGLAAARIIRASAGDELVPIIFLTSLQDADSLADCLESGGDDFLSKPYQRVILQAKIKAFSRMRAMHAALQENHDQLILEQEVARKVYDTVTQGSAAASQFLRTVLSSKALFNGDTVLAQHRPDGGLHVFVGDFTGHGLPAAIGTLPLADTFYGMTQKGFELEEIVREMNSKLMRVLPVHLFCCGALLHLDLRQKMARLWLGGLPDCFLLTLDRKLVPLSSDNLPLGVNERADQPLVVREFPMHDGERLFLWSDGIVEARNTQQELFGEERVRAILADASDPAAIFDELLRAVAEFRGAAGHADDTTLVEATMGPPPDDVMDIASTSETTTLSGQDWQVEFVFPVQTLKTQNPMPLIMHMISETESLSPYSSQLYTVISELYSNALEHGVLGLDSQLKRSEDGFAQYYQQRASRLEGLTEGRIVLRLEQHPRPGGGVMTVRVEDSGPGFTVPGLIGNGPTAALSASNPTYRVLSGRGINLVRQLCSRVEYLGRGNIVEVDFIWPRRRVL